MLAVHSLYTANDGVLLQGARRAACQLQQWVRGLNLILTRFYIYDVAPQRGQGL